MLSLAVAVKAHIGKLPSEIPLQARLSVAVHPPDPRLMQRYVPHNDAQPETRPDRRPFLPRVADAANGKGPSGAGLVRLRLLKMDPETCAPGMLVPELQAGSQVPPNPALPLSELAVVPLPEPQLEPVTVSTAQIAPLLIAAAPLQLLLSAPGAAAPEPALETAAQPEPQPDVDIEHSPDPSLLDTQEFVPSEILAALANAVHDDALELEVLEVMAEQASEAVAEPIVEATFEVIAEPVDVPPPATPELQEPPIAAPTECLPLPAIDPAPRPQSSREPHTIDALPQPLAPNVVLPHGSEDASLPPAPPVHQPAAPRRQLRPVLPGWLISLVVATTLSLGGAIVIRNMDLAHKAAAAPAPAAEPASSPQDAFAGFLEVTGLRVVADLKNGSRLHYVLVNHSATQVSNAQLQISVRSGGGAPAKPLFTVSALVTGLGPYESREMVTDIGDLNAKEIPEWQMLRPEVHLLSR